MVYVNVFRTLLLTGICFIVSGQISRLKECEKMIVAMEISKWLNDYPTYLQCVVQTYGLIAPILQAEIDSEPVLQVKLILKRK